MQLLNEYACNKLHISTKQFEEAFFYGRNETKRGIETLAAAHNRMIYMQKMLEYLHVNPFSYALELYNVYWDYFLENIKLIDGSEMVLESLQKKEVKLAICTDQTAQIQHRKIRKLGLDRYMQYIVSSEEVGAEKPDARIFKKVLEKMNLRGEEVIYIGDDYKRDIIGANNCGISTYWFNTNEKQKSNESVECYQFASYKELREIIEREF